MPQIFYCQSCKYYLYNKKCFAFNNIPNEIFKGELTHDKILFNQNKNYIYSKASDVNTLNENDIKP